MKTKNSKLLSIVVLIVLLPSLGGVHAAVEEDYFVFFPLVAGTGSPYVNLVTNGGFEDGRTRWAEFEDNLFTDYPLIVHESELPAGITPQRGDWVSWLGGDSDMYSSIEQEIALPASPMQLTYWHWIDSIFVCDLSYGGVSLNGTLVDSYQLCSNNATGGWALRAVDVSTYAGLTVTLRFESQTTLNNYSNLFIDTMSLQEIP